MNFVVVALTLVAVVQQLCGNSTDTFAHDKLFHFFRWVCGWMVATSSSGVWLRMQVFILEVIQSPPYYNTRLYDTLTIRHMSC